MWKNETSWMEWLQGVSRWEQQNDASSAITSISITLGCEYSKDCSPIIYGDGEIEIPMDAIFQIQIKGQQHALDALEQKLPLKLSAKHNENGTLTFIIHQMNASDLKNFLAKLKYASSMDIKMFEEVLSHLHVNQKVKAFANPDFNRPPHEPGCLTYVWNSLVQASDAFVSRLLDEPEPLRKPKDPYRQIHHHMR